MTLLIAPLLTAGIAVGSIQNSYAGNLNSSPTADPNGPYNGELGSSIMFDGSGSSDPDGDALKFDWDFGDGNSDTGSTPTHTYLTIGTFVVCLTVDDGNRGTDTVCTTAETVDTTPPTIICPIDITLNTGEDTSPANTGAATATDDPNPDPTPTFSDDVSQNLDGTKMFVVGNDGDDVNEYTLSTPFDVSTAFFVDSFSVAAQDTVPTGVTFSSDGAKMFVVGIDGVAVYEYTLATPFDVSTAFFVDSFSVAAQDTGPSSVTFSSDGAKMFVVGITGEDVNEYTLSTGFDVSTAFFVDSFSVAAQDTVPTGIAFSSDGAKMFVVGIDGDDVNEYTLTTPFDVSTASFVDSFSVAAQETVPTGVAFSSDGAKMFVVGAGGDDVNEYTLATPFDVSTASFVDSFSVAAQDTAPRDVAFSSDGTTTIVRTWTATDAEENTVSCSQIITVLPTAIEKTLVEGPNEIGIYLPGPTAYTYTIVYTGTAALVTDTVPAEFEVLSLVATDGTADFFKPGKGAKSQSSTKIEWLVLEGTSTLTVDIQTVKSPGHGKKTPDVFKPTSCGPLPINDGATAFEVDINGDLELVTYTDPITGEETLHPVVIVGPSNSLEVEAVDGAKLCIEIDDRDPN